MSDEKNILSIDFDDDNNDYQSFDEFIQNDTERKKNLVVRNIEEQGELLVGEIERKKKEKEHKATKLIPYILKHYGWKYDEQTLYSYSYEDVKDIYDEIRIEKRPLIVKIFHFLFNL